ncbi:MAG: DUF3427 domain-containing protein [Fimbriimonadales bacterium]|nr:DUF3427 domain-containing protein [Fimbriimonadales bacterium]
MRAFPPGAYDLLLTDALLERLRTDRRAEIVELAPEDAIDYLARELAERAKRRLRQKADDDGPQPLLAVADGAMGSLGDPDRWTVSLLKQIRDVSGRVYDPPILPLSFSALVTNRQELNYLEVVASELRSADRVDLICPFIGYQGVLRLRPWLAALGSNLRVLTTTYLGATSARALEELSAMGARVKIAYEGPEQRTSLHAKAWIFHRHSGFTTATIGSSNLSHRALVDGLEWNVRLGAMDGSSLLEGLIDTFERLWNDESVFAPFDPAKDKERLVRSLRCQSGGDREFAAFLDVRPYPHQQEALELLRLSRLEGRHANLIVAATGTGKTVTAALDYKALAEERRRLPRLLFVAHRREILQQARDTYRHVLRDGQFGELLTGQETPELWNHVFATVQSLSRWEDERLAGLETDVLVIDEFHHAEAATYRRLLDLVRRNELLALTATPERTDGVNVADWFGGPTYELRLWHALDRGLLCPFHYWGIDDGTDLSRVEWRDGRYDVRGLEREFIERGQPRVEAILRHLSEKVEDVSAMRAVAFCVSVRHAEYMAEEFRRSGLRAEALHASLEPGLRADIEQRFRRGDLQLVCTVDLFNEGVDVPEIDTILFLRPTESALLFTQQLGRGLRRHPTKRALTVLDFVGRQNQKFRFDLRLRALTGLSRKGLEQSASRGFCFLPPGCDVRLDKVTQQRVLDALRRSVPTSMTDFVSEYRRLAADGPVTLRRFLEQAGIEPEQLYAGGRTFTEVRERALGGSFQPSAGHRRLGSLLHVRDRSRAQAYVRAARGETEGPWARQLRAALLQDPTAADPVDRGTVEELEELLELLTSPGRPFEPLARSAPDPTGLEDLPFCLHAAYTRDEIVAPFRDNPRSMRQGVFFVRELGIDVNLVTLDKSEREFSPTTRYADVLLSPTMLQWESQSTLTREAPTARRILDRSNWRQLFFVRPRKTDASGQAMPFHCLGWAVPVRDQGERPIRVWYELLRPVPDSLELPLEASSG